MARDDPHAALVVAQTQEVHDELSNLLTLLRRSRYEALRADRPWDRTAAPAADQPLMAPWPTSSVPPPRLSALPVPTAEELAALAGRHLPDSGQWEWRRTAPNGTATETIVLRRQAGRLEIRLADRVLRRRRRGRHRVAGVGARRAGQLGRKRPPGGRRLAAVAAPSQQRRTRAAVPCRPKRRRPRAFDPGRSAGHGQYVVGGRVCRSEWPAAALAVAVGRHAFRAAASGDIQGPADRGDGRRRGKVLLRWELVRAEIGHVQVPAVDADWLGCVRLDRRSPQPAVDWGVSKALEAIAAEDWPKALDQLHELLKTRPRQPLLLLLSAWCGEHDPQRCSHEQVVTLLKNMARQGLGRLVREVREENFPSLSPAERYRIMSCQPDDTLVAQDRDDLARLAAELGRLDEALAHAQAALQSGSGAGQFERQCMVVDLLARLGKTAEAAENARRWATATGATTEQLTAMGELLAKSGNEAAGDELFVRALAAKQLTRQQRFGVMCRRALDSSSEPAVATLAGCRRSYASRLARPPQMLGHDCRRVGRAQPGGGCRATGQPDARPGTQVGIDVRASPFEHRRGRSRRSLLADLPSRSPARELFRYRFHRVERRDAAAAGDRGCRRVAAQRQAVEFARGAVRLADCLPCSGARGRRPPRGDERSRAACAADAAEIGSPASQMATPPGSRLHGRNGRGNVLT